MSSIRQASFAGGEISPRLAGRSDLKKLTTALGKCRNMVVTPEGALQRRPGTQPCERFASTLWFTGATGDPLPRMIPFHFRDGQNAVLLFWKGLIYVYRYGSRSELVVLTVETRFSTWSSATAYDEGARVVYGSSEFECILAHTNQIPAAPSTAYWRQIGPLVPYQTTPVTWHNQVKYLAGTRVVYSGTEYRAIRDVWNQALTAPPSDTANWVRDDDAYDLTKLKYAQCGDIITLTHPSYPPMELRRYAAANWKLFPLSFDPAAAWLPGTPFIETDELAPFVNGNDKRINISDGHYGVPWQWAISTVGQTEFGIPFETSAMVVTEGNRANASSYTAWANHVTYALGAKVLYQGNYYSSKKANNVGHAPFGSKQVKGSGGRSGGSTRTVVDQWWGKVSESAMGTADGLPYNYALFRDRPVTINWGGTDVDAAAYRVLGYRIYRGKSDVFGLVADVDSKTTRYIDDGIEPDYTQQPPMGTNPFQLKDATDAPYPARLPAVVGFFEQRRVFANGYGQPNWVCFSDTGDFDGFDRRLIPTADDSFDFALASERLEDIRSLVPMRSLVALTGAGVWIINGEGGPFSPATATSVLARRALLRGMAWTDPVIVGDSLLALESNQRILRELISAPNGAGFENTDMTILASHLLEGRATTWTGIVQSKKITAMAYDWTRKILWCVTNDGGLLGCTYIREHEVIAWHRHDFYGQANNGSDTTGKVVDLAVVEEDGKARVYLAIMRPDGSGNAALSVERFNVDPHLDQYGNYIADYMAAYPSGLDHEILLDHTAIVSTSQGAGYFNVTFPAWAVGQKVWLYLVTYGNPARCQGWGPINVTATTMDLFSTLGIARPQALSGYQMWFGLSYPSEIELLEPDLDQEGHRNNVRSVQAVDIEVFSAYGGLKAGLSSSSPLVPWTPAGQWVDPGSGAIKAKYLPFTGKINLRPSASYVSDGKVYILQEGPYPLLINGITRDVIVGGNP